MTGWNRADLEGIHRHSNWHRERIVQSGVCGCFYCLEMFPSADIVEWIPEPGKNGELVEDVTALCPRCGIDAVLPDSVPDAPLSPELLQAMQAYWFEKSRSPRQNGHT
jgi:hypothetical protein